MKTNEIKNNLKKIPLSVWILVLIVLVGIFLRAFHFHDWLEFRRDQVRDTRLVEQVVQGQTSWPLLGPYMNRSGENEEAFFHLGPAYYYFQIVSAKIFGVSPHVLAFPDLAFSILSIPLFYIFLRLYFGINISLGLTALFAFSSYFVHYSRFAWNSNLIPFFVLLFLLACNKFLNENERQKWIWSVLLGIALGIGFQIHAILMLLFSVVTIAIFIISLKKDFSLWKKWLVVFLIFSALNVGQIIHEAKTNFENSRKLLGFSSQNEEEPVSKLAMLGNAADCQIEGNLFFLSSFGGNNCSYRFSSIFTESKTKLFAKISKNKIYWSASLLGLIFSIFGYLLLIYYNRKETKSERKNFLRLAIFYAAVAFIIMIPLSVKQFDDLRYLSPVFFIPYLLLGLVINYLGEKFSKILVISASLAIFALLIVSNISSLSVEASTLINKERTCSTHFTTLGELEPVAEYIKSESDNQKKVFIDGYKEMEVTVDPLIYLLEKKGVTAIKIENNEDFHGLDGPGFIVSCRDKFEARYNFKKINSIYVYHQ